MGNASKMERYSERRTSGRPIPGAFGRHKNAERLRRICALRNWPLYLAVQDGMSSEAVESALVDFEGLFLGGTSKFKLRAGEFAVLAKSLAKPAHYGRCGTPHKVRHAREHKYDSIDSAFPLWRRDRMKEFERAVVGRELQLRHPTMLAERKVYGG